MRPARTFQLGLPQLRELVAFLAAIGFSLCIANATHFTFLVPHTYERSTLALYSHRMLEEPADVLVVGSSRVGMSFDSELLAQVSTERLGEPVSVYELVQHGMSSWLLYDVVRDFALERPPRRLLVVDVNVQLFDNQTAVKANALKQVGSVRDLAAIDWSRLSRGQVQALLGTLVRGVQVVWNLGWALDPEVLEIRDWQRAHGGELSEDLHQRLETRERYMRARRLVYRHRDENLGDFGLGAFQRGEASIRYDFRDPWFAKVLDLLQAAPCDVLFVRTPVRPDFFRRIAPEDEQRFQEEVVAEIRRRGFGYEDLNRPPYPREPEAFLDIVHMAPGGRERTSRRFVEELLAPRLRRGRPVIE